MRASSNRADCQCFPNAVQVFDYHLGRSETTVHLQDEKKKRWCLEAEATMTMAVEWAAIQSNLEEVYGRRNNRQLKLVACGDYPLCLSVFRVSHLIHLSVLANQARKFFSWWAVLCGGLFIKKIAKKLDKESRNIYLPNGRAQFGLA